MPASTAAGESGQFAEISARTLEHYNARPEAFRAGTADHDVSQNIAALLKAIEGAAPLCMPSDMPISTPLTSAA